MRDLAARMPTIDEASVWRWWRPNHATIARLGREDSRAAHWRRMRKLRPTNAVLIFIKAAQRDATERVDEFRCYTRLILDPATLLWQRPAAVACRSGRALELRPPAAAAAAA